MLSVRMQAREMVAREGGRGDKVLTLREGRGEEKARMNDCSGKMMG